MHRLRSAHKSHILAMANSYGRDVYFIHIQSLCFFPFAHQTSIHSLSSNSTPFSRIYVWVMIGTKVREGFPSPQSD